MSFVAKSTPIEQVKSDCLIVATFTDGSLSTSAQAMQKQDDGNIAALLKNGEISGKLGNVVTVFQAKQKNTAVLLVGFGDKNTLDAESFRKGISHAAKALKNKTYKQVAIAIDDIQVDGLNSAEKASYCAQQITYTQYTFVLPATPAKKVSNKKTNFTYLCEKVAPVKAALHEGEAIGEGMNVARQLGNLPGNICTPTYLANQAKLLARNHKTITAKILSEKQMADLGMGSLLSVSAGSDEPAQFIIMEYKGAAKSVKPHVLVGKGITFDTGGISLKGGAGMDEMKFDMCGAASVFGTVNALAALEPTINVVAIVAAAENMPNGNATKPGDIVTAMSGTTIEVLNTDAEGRLVLCDALSYAERYKPQSVVDIATLTGACVVALGSHATGLFSNNDALAQSLLESGTHTGDRAWQMPIWGDYKKQLESNFADLANVGGRQAGSITAACFLSYFTENYPWAHLDIAGTAWLSGGQKGATGRPVPLLTHYLLKQAK